MAEGSKILNAILRHSNAKLQREAKSLKFQNKETVRRLQTNVMESVEINQQLKYIDVYLLKTLN